MKQVIFNVGGALATYTEIDDKKIIVDIGKSEDFNPVIDFLLPLFEKRKNKKSKEEPSKFYIDQLILSHPHNDHIACIKDFDESFYVELLTCPHNNDDMSKDEEAREKEKVNWELFEKNDNLDYLRKMFKGRRPPLVESYKDKQFIYYLQPKVVEDSEDLNSAENYPNNISISTFFIINGHRIYLPGDIQKNGMKELLEKKFHLRKKLEAGVDILIAPHHGLRSSFSAEMFKSMKNGKTRCLNIISEKPNTDDSRNVDSRYSSSDYCSGENNLGTKDEPSYQIKTSHGHIFIDYSQRDNPKIEIISDVDELIKRFC